MRISIDTWFLVKAAFGQKRISMDDRSRPKTAVGGGQ